MALQTFNTAALAEFDGGRLAKALEREVKRAIEDCKDRPGDERARKVLLQFDFIPATDDTGDFDACTFAFQCAAKLPPAQSRAYSFGVKKTGQLYFNDLSLDEAAQMTIDESDGRQQKPR